MNKTIKCRPISLLITSPILNFDVNELHMHTYLSPPPPPPPWLGLRCDFFKGYIPPLNARKWHSELQIELNLIIYNNF